MNAISSFSTIILDTPLRGWVPLIYSVSQHQNVQSSVLGALLLSLYADSLGDVILSNGFKLNLYVIDSQIFISNLYLSLELQTFISIFLFDFPWTSNSHLKLIAKVPSRSFPLKPDSLAVYLSVDSNTTFSVVQIQNVGIIFDSSILYHSLHTQSTNPISSTFKTCAEFEYFLVL